jgi:8-oxo-dGTP pyrophosphatase MutT (NUDIX family)/uncharacterized LabA/DUF88 family protein
MKLNLPPDEYYAQLAKIPTSGGAIFRNEKGEFLIVKQTYREYWNIPGGLSDKDETPREAVIREVKEEIGITISTARCFCIDFAKKPPFDRILFLFDCGILDEKTISKIKLDTDEISEYKFLPYDEMMRLLSDNIKRRFTNSIEAYRNGTCVYIEDGAEVFERKFNYAFIDSQNLNLSINALGWKLNFARFRRYLKDKYNVSKAFLFIGYIEGNKKMYAGLEKAGFTCIFKPTLGYKDGKTKGNCDAELVLQTIVESRNYNKALIVTGDGDFNCLVRNLISANKLEAVLIPNKLKFSALLKYDEIKPFLRYMNDLRAKLEYTQEKAP